MTALIFYNTFYVTRCNPLGCVKSINEVLMCFEEDCYIFGRIDYDYAAVTAHIKG